ncbi:uncharacterized protein LOC130637355 [Hydractinia symbiolongicarpus]|uniref:uncharacterized protein LOC130637355 n=1 Tax=Hydractinia symbiolongicarpus TaxID=13093 RepID=UPI00254DD02F|nr:uncharacterized protein LOC130637355 [Hydractinia symbiolongicarpus]
MEEKKLNNHHSQTRTYNARDKVLKEDNDLDVWSKINVCAKSDEDEDEEGNKIFRSLPWRTEEVSDLIRRCDMALEVIRKYGEPSERAPNVHCLEFVKLEL